MDDIIATWKLNIYKTVMPKSYFRLDPESDLARYMLTQFMITVTEVKNVDRVYVEIMMDKELIGFNTFKI